VKSREQRRENRKSVISVVLVLILSVIGCAGPKAYIIHLRPQDAGEPESKTDLTIAVVPFEDQRPSVNVLGERVLRNGNKEPILLESPSISEDITYILRRSMKARGIEVVELSQWDPVPENLENLPQEVDVALAGRIETLAVEAQSSTFKTKVQYQVKLSARLGFRKQGKVVTKSIKVSPEETVVQFKLEKVEEGLNEALGTALESLLETALSSSNQE
jgi:hypothetical protein